MLHYELQMVEKKHRWLWLLALLPLLLLFVKCSHDIDVETIDKFSEKPVVCDSISISYTSHFLFKDGHFFVNEDVNASAVPDSTGVAHFEDLPCSVYSYIFYALAKIEYSIHSQCYQLPDSPEVGNFHYVWHKTLKVEPQTAELILTVVDRETNDPLANATLLYSYSKSDNVIADSILSDAAGRCVLNDVPKCATLEIARASCYAYKDTTDVTFAVADILNGEEEPIVKLTPIKESFTFFVHNKFTRQPVPGATVEVVLKNQNNIVRHGPITTNVDGKGRGSFADAFVGATLELRASKVNYRDSIYTPICTVQEFIDKPDSLRVIYLEPLPHTQTFINVDSITRKPIPGVANHIVVNSINGKQYQYDEISNRQGVFTFMAIEGDNIVIDSKLSPLYEPKHTEIPSFEKGDTILMKPIYFDLTFRTVEEVGGKVLPGCQLSIRTTQSGVVKPTNSGNGVFTVSGLIPTEKISIVASKAGYETNDYTICNDLVSALLQAPSERRDIPLEIKSEPCNGGSVVPKTGLRHQQTYNMGQESGKASIWTDFKGVPDRLLVYDGPDTSYPCLIDKNIPQYDLVEFDFHNRYITVVVITSPTDSSSNWEYKVNCPNN